MKSQNPLRHVAVACLAVTLTLASPAAAQKSEAAPPGISPEAIAALRQDLAQAGAAKTKTRKRRAYKRVLRTGRSLLQATPDAPERWRVLDIMFQGQKRLLVAERSASNRRALFEICGELAAAPDTFAELRLEADLLLSEQKLSLANADVAARARALAELIRRYRGTPGEAKSLMMASQIAPKLEAFDLEMEILRAMQERFSDDHEVIEFRRKSLAAGRIEALFRGAFTRTDGTTLRFPVDRLGHPCLLVFWSRSTPGFEVALRKIDARRTQFPDRFDFYSLNLDELPDAGEATLRALQLPWVALRLPAGKKSQTFRTYGRREPVSILVNAYGYTLLTPTHNYGRGHGGAVDPYQIDPVRITDPRYLAQLQSLFIGDFLVGSPGVPESHPLGPSLRAIGECFPAVPFRYRLTRTLARANYEKAAQLCDQAIARHPKHPDLWRIRNRRILALLGMWKTAGEPGFLRQAGEEARACLASTGAGTRPEGADVVPRFCLAKAALRSSQGEAKSILSGFIDATGGKEAPGSAVAAAVILALDANSRELHHHYRDILLARHTDDPALWPVVTFLRDRYHTLDLLKVKLSRGERRIRSRYGDHVGPRGHAINHGLDPSTARLPDIELRTLAGKPLRLPEETEGKLTILLFVEPPADPEADFPVKLDRSGRPTKNDPLRTVMGYAIERAGLHVHKEVRVLAAFLTEDADRVRALMQKNQWSCETALVPGGLGNPMVQRLGILSADRIPNVFLLRRDGSIAWHTSGFFYKSDFGYPFAIRLALKVHIEVCDTQLAFRALAAGEYEEAQRIFSGPFRLEKDERYRWRAPRFHGRALAHAGREDWAAALADIDTAIAAHRQEFDHAEDRPCVSMMRLRRTRATILSKLGREKEAQAARDAAAVTPTAYPATPYELFHKKLAELSLPR